LGDSHTAADYLTGALRARLEKRFGVGGPGFVRVGLKPYRHSQVRWSCDGPWKIEPVPPPRRTLFDDGVFGLGGMRALPYGGPAQASFELSPGAANGRLHWQLWFSLKDGASFRLTLGGVSQVVTLASRVPELPGAGFASLALESAPTEKLELLTLTGSPRFYGLIAEGSEPGVVLDAVGIDGARLATALAWSETSFEAALRARAPSLVALAFGTNEAFDADKIEKYRAHYQDFLARVRLGAPNADCLIVGPPDSVAVTGGSEPRVTELDSLQRAVASELGCGFVSQLQIMGGAGGYSRWAHQSPPLARGDRLHLSAKGYEVMAEGIADELLAGYERRAR
jgi:lysophospholipase L1-like esterase